VGHVHRLHSPLQAPGWLPLAPHVRFAVLQCQSLAPVAGSCGVVGRSKGALHELKSLKLAASLAAFS
jgi:hypothetical protein